MFDSGYTVCNENVPYHTTRPDILPTSWWCNAYNINSISVTLLLKISPQVQCFLTSSCIELVILMTNYKKTIFKNFFPPTLRFQLYSHLSPLPLFSLPNSLPLLPFSYIIFTLSLPLPSTHLLLSKPFYLCFHPIDLQITLIISPPPLPTHLFPFLPLHLKHIPFHLLPFSPVTCPRPFHLSISPFSSSSFISTHFLLFPPITYPFYPPNVPLFLPPAT